MRLLTLCVLAACGGSELDGTWTGTWTASNGRGSNSGSGPIALTLDGSDAEGVLDGVAFFGELDGTTLRFSCGADCTPFPAPVDVAGDLDVVAERLVGTLYLTNAETGADVGFLDVEAGRE